MLRKLALQTLSSLTVNQVKMKFFLVAVVIALIGLAAGELPLVRYDSFKIYKIQVNDPTELSYYKKLTENLDIFQLKEPGVVGRSYDVVVSPALQRAFEERLRYYELRFDVTCEDLQELLESTYDKIVGAIKPDMGWTEYHGLDDIYNWLNNLVLRNPRTVKPYTVGLSYEKRPIKAIKYSQRRGNKAIWINSNIHAIEWITSAATTCFFDRLINNPSAELKRLREEYDWIYVPMMNPDGFVYTKEVSPLWRKNRKPTGFSNSSGPCYGTDMNRNFDFHWGEAGYNLNVPCDHFYAGRKAFSEPETTALKKFFNKFPNNYVRVFLDVHSYGNLVLLPYGHTKEVRPPNYQQMMTIAQAFADSASAKYGTVFRYGSSGDVLYPVSGATKDWAYGLKNINFTATIELRDSSNGPYGFFLPANQILEVCDEFEAGVIGMIKAAEGENLFA